MKRYKFKVKPKHKDGALDFPMDMLRYDRCYPTTTEGATDIAAICYLRADDQAAQFIGTPTIELQSNDKVPTSKRWESMGWIVTNVESFRQ